MVWRVRVGVVWRAKVALKATVHCKGIWLGIGGSADSVPNDINKNGTRGKVVEANSFHGVGTVCRAVHVAEECRSR